MLEERLPVKSAFIWILLTTVLVSGTIVMGYLYYRYSLEKRMQDHQYDLLAIEHPTEEEDPLPTNYIAEYLGLSLDNPTNLYQISIGKAAERLAQCPLIASCALKKKTPSTLFIQYERRGPFAELVDYTNTLVDAEGFLFPNKPFHKNEARLKIYLGLAESVVQWGTMISGENWRLAKEVKEYFSQFNEIKPLQIDTSKSFSQSYGKREIVFSIEIDTRQHFLRCSTRNYKKEIKHFLTMRTFLTPSSRIIDLRIPSMIMTAIPAGAPR